MAHILKIVISRSLSQVLSAFGMFLASIWQALPKSILRRLFGLQEHISLEIVGEPDRVQLQIWAPYRAVAGVLMDQLRAHFPGLEINSSAEEVPKLRELATAELVLGMSRERSLRTMKESEADPMAGVLASLSGLSADEWGIIQILIRPALAPSMQTLAFQVIVRLLASAGTIRRARNRLGNMIAAFGQFGAENALKPRRIRANSHRSLQGILRRHWPLLRLNPSLLTLEELTGMYHLPSPAKVRNRHLEIAGARRLPPPARLPHRGVRVGLVPANGRESEVRLRPEDLLNHLVLFGATGTGKSTLLRNLVLDLISLGYGVTVMDPHGSLASDLLASIPESRLDDLILLRFADAAYPVGLNFLTARTGYEFLTVDELVEVCQRIYDTGYWGPVLDMVLRHAAWAALETGGTLVEMARILDDDLYRQSILPRIANPETQRFLQRLSNYRAGTREQKVASTLHRLQCFLGTPLIRNIVGQTRSTLNARQVMDQARILLVDLSGIGVSNARFLGSLLTLLFRQGALSREDTPESQRVPHFLLMDECSWFISRSVGEMADQMRKFRLGMILAAQRLGQLKPKETREAVFANAGTLISFRMGDKDEALYLARHFNTPELTAEEIRHLGEHEIYAQVTHRGVRLPAFWARTPPPPSTDHRNKERIERLIQRSRETYALPREVVEEEIASRQRKERYDEPEKRHRQDPPAGYPSGPGDHPGGGQAWSHGPKAGSEALLSERW